MLRILIYVVIYLTPNTIINFVVFDLHHLI
jgi:hypothetical protein